MFYKTMLCRSIHIFKACLLQSVWPLFSSSSQIISHRDYMFFSNVHRLVWFASDSIPSVQQQIKIRGNRKRCCRKTAMGYWKGHQVICASHLIPIHHPTRKRIKVKKVQVPFSFLLIPRSSLFSSLCTFTHPSSQRQPHQPHGFLPPWSR